MNCQTCGHTFDCIFPSALWWCPRCGSIETRGTLGEGTCTPQLVKLCREFEPAVFPKWQDLWRRLGIEESIHTPEERKAP